MPNRSTQDKDSTGSNRKLVIILVIIAIGIPVLIELFTFFNLVKVQLFEEQKKTNGVEKIRETGRKEAIATGDTLFAVSPGAVILQDKRISVTPYTWKFQMGFISDSQTAAHTYIHVDSLSLQSGRMLSVQQSLEWQKEQDARNARAHFGQEIPSGDMPYRIFLQLQPAPGADFLPVIRRTFLIGSVPVRYQRQGN